VLVKWSASPKSLATWEDMEVLKQRFPMTPAWGQATSYGWVNVIKDSPKIGLASNEEDQAAGQASEGQQELRGLI
jgi:hypothetical protein